MKTRYLLYPVIAGLATGLLLLLATMTAGTSADWLSSNLFVPGQLLAAMLFSHQPGTPTSPLYLFVEFVLNFGCTWVGLIFAVYLLDRIVVSLYELTKY